MLEQSLLLKLSSPGITDNTTSRLRQEYQAYQGLFQIQSSLVQQFLGAQAAALAEAVVQGIPEVHFSLPDLVACLPTSSGSMELESVPTDHRAQMAGGLLGRMTHTGLRTALSRRLSELERLVETGSVGQCGSASVCYCYSYDL